MTKLTMGSMVAQLVGVLIAPVLTRLFSPGDLGLFTYLLSITAIFMGVVNARYDMAIVVAVDEGETARLGKGALIVGGVVSVLIGVGFACYSATSGHAGESWWWSSLFVFLVTLSYAVINVLTAYNNRARAYGLITRVTLVRSLVQNLGGALAGLLRAGAAGLLVTYALGQFFGIASQARPVRQQLLAMRQQRWPAVRTTLAEHWRQAAYSAPALLANSASYGLIVVLMGATYGMTQVGFYSVSVRLLGLPLAVVSGNVARVFLEEAAREMETTRSFSRAFVRAAGVLGALALPLWAVLNFAVPALMDPIFGRGWTQAGTMVQLLAPMFCIRFVTTAVSPGFLVGKQQHWELVVSLALVAAGIGSWGYARWAGLDVLGFLGAINVTFLVVYFAAFILLWGISRRQREAVEDDPSVAS